MRYTRLKQKIEAGIVHRDVTTPVLKTTKAALAKNSKKRKAAEKDEDSSEDDEDDFSFVVEEYETAEPPTKRQTRGKRIVVNATFESDSASSVSHCDSTSDEYEESQNTSDDEGFSEDDDYEMSNRHKGKSRLLTAYTKVIPVKSAVKSAVKATLTPQSIPSQEIKANLQDVPDTSSSIRQTLKTPLTATLTTPSAAMNVI